MAVDGVSARVAPHQEAGGQNEFELIVLLSQLLVPVIDLFVQLPESPLRTLPLRPASPAREPRSVRPQHFSCFLPADGAVLCFLFPLLRAVRSPHELPSRPFDGKRRITAVRVLARVRGHPPLQYLRQGRRRRLRYVVEREQQSVASVRGTAHGNGQVGQP